MQKIITMYNIWINKTSLEEILSIENLMFFTLYLCIYLKMILYIFYNIRIIETFSREFVH